MAGIIGKKIGMTSMYTENGKNIPCTLIEAGPCVVTQVKTVETDGYSAIQVAFDDKREKSANSAEKGHFAKAGTSPKMLVKEFQFENNFKKGDLITLELFAEGQFVDVVAKSKGKGFQGVVKRHGFAGVGESTHGQHNRLRAPGSIGSSSYPSRVFKGIRMAGRTGNANITVQNLQVMKILRDKNILVLKGAIPGPKGGYILIER